VLWNSLEQYTEIRILIRQVFWNVRKSLSLSSPSLKSIIIIITIIKLNYHYHQHHHHHQHHQFKFPGIIEKKRILGDESLSPEALEKAKNESVTTQNKTLTTKVLAKYQNLRAELEICLPRTVTDTKWEAVDEVETHGGGSQALTRFARDENDEIVIKSTKDISASGVNGVNGGAARKVSDPDAAKKRKERRASMLNDNKTDILKKSN
jgi:hypothetical protein